MILGIIIINRQGQVRLKKIYDDFFKDMLDQNDKFIE